MKSNDILVDRVYVIRKRKPFMSGKYGILPERIWATVPTPQWAQLKSGRDESSLPGLNIAMIG